MHPRYHDWLKYVFDHEVADPQWYFNSDAPCFATTPQESCELLKLTFQRAGTDLVNYSDAQVDQGFWFIVSTSGSDYILDLKASAVPLRERVASMGSIYNLYQDCFARRCSESLGHLDEPASDLNSICYMFWDVCPLTSFDGAADREEMEDAVFSVLYRILTIPHRACIEAALHGLSELAIVHGERVGNIVDEWLSATRPDGALENYARLAKRGLAL